MKKNLSTIIAAISCGITIVCLMQIADLRNQIRSLESDLSFRLSTVQDSVSRISSNISYELEQQQNLLSTKEYTLGEPDFAAKTVTLSCSITPKTYDPDKTKAALLCGDKQYPLTLTGGSYTANLTIPLFEETDITAVQLETDGVISTQSLDWYLSPFDNYIADVSASYSGQSTIQPKDGVAAKTYNGGIDININQKSEPCVIRSITLVECIDSKVTNTTDIPIDSTDTMEAAGDTTVATQGIQYPTHFYYEMKNKTVGIPNGSSYLLYVEVVDEYGLHHRSYVDSEIIGADGQPTKTPETPYVDAIYDENGDPLYGPDITELY